jgi:hypothetical protein
MSDHDDDAQVQALVSEELEAAKKMAVEPAPEVTVDEDLQSIRIVDPQLHTASHEENLYKWDDIVGDQMDEHDKLFDVFVVVGLKQKEPATFFRFDASLKPEIKTYGQLEYFCYPNEDVLPLHSVRPGAFKRH